MKRNSILTILIFTGLILSSCNKDYDFDKLRDPVWEPDIALPIAIGDLGIDDLIEQDSNSIIHTDSNALITLIYDGDLISIEPDLVVPINVKNYNDNVTLSGAEGTDLINNGTVSTSFTQDVVIDNVNVNGVSVALDSLILNEGIMGISFTNGLAHNASVKIDIPGMELSGVPYTNTVNVAASATENFNIDMAGYRMDLTKGGTTTNTIEIVYTITFTKSASNSTAGSLAINTSLNGTYRLKLAYGDAMNQNIFANKDGDLIIEIFEEDILGQTMFFEDPSIRFYWDNSFGVPMQMVFNSISGTNKQNQTFTLGTSTVDPADLLILAPSTVGGSVQGEFTLDKTNTTGGGGDLNIVDFIHQNIFDMDFDIDAITNPGSVSLPPYKNFIDENSELTLNYEVILPLHGRAIEYAITDTFGLDFGEDLEDVEEMSLRLYSENMFPAEIALDLVFLDVNGVPLFTLSSAPELIVPSGLPNSEGRVTSPTISRRDLVVDPQDIDLFDQVENIVITGNFSTFVGGSTSVKFYDDNNLIVKLGVRAKFKTEID
jgi:hypothetical protein